MQVMVATNGRLRPVCHVVSANQIKSIRSKFENLRRPGRKSPTSTDVNLCSRGAYQIAVAVERIQETRLVGAGIRLDSPQCALVNEECSFQRTVVPPEPHGSPGLVI